MPWWTYPAIWAGTKVFDWLTSDKGGGGEGEKKPTKPQMGAFQPYLYPWDTTAFESKLGEYGKEQRKGVLKGAAGRGDYGGPGGVIPGQLDVASQMTKSLADYEIMMQQMQAQNVYTQYMAYIGQKYGLDSMEYEQAYNAYMQKTKGQQAGQAAMWSGGLGLAGSIAGALPWGDWFGGGDGGEGLGEGLPEGGMGDWTDPFGGYG